MLDPAWGQGGVNADGIQGRRTIVRWGEAVGPAPLGKEPPS